MLPGPVSFTITFNKGDARLFEELFGEVKGMISCQRLTKINTQYQGDLANGSYCIKDIMPRSKRDSFMIVFAKQPGYYPPPHNLITLMDQTITGITEFTLPLGFPHPDFSAYNPAPNPYGSLPVSPVVPEAPVFNQIQVPTGVTQSFDQYPINSIEATAQPIPAEQKPEQVFYPPLENLEVLCNYCKKTGPDYSMMKLTCEHWTHNMCLVYYMQNTMQSSGSIKDILCIDCGHSIDYTILKTVGGELADQLYGRTSHDAH